MKRLLFLIVLPLLWGCETYTEESTPVTYMGGGKWILIDYDIVIVNSISAITIVENDTICINSFNEIHEDNNGLVMKQNYDNTSISRRFIKNKTQWEFDGYNLYCEWNYTIGGMTPSHDPFWVTYPNSLYSNYTIMSIMDETTGTKTDFSFTTNNKGVAPPNELTLVSPNIVIDMYSSSGARDKAVTLKVILTFMR